ncbi:MAG: protein-arginine deiminase family protein [Nannocystales bacterium]
MTSISGFSGYPDEAGPIETKCPKACRVVVVAYAYGLDEKLPGATVTFELVGTGLRNTQTADDEFAAVTFDIKEAPVSPSDMSVTVEHPVHGRPHANEFVKGAVVAGKGFGTIASCGPVGVVEMFLDSSRTNAIDDEPTDHTTWTWGSDGVGGVLMVNGRTYPEDTDTVQERIEVKFKWKPEKDPSTKWTCRLGTSSTLVRAFVGPTQAAAELPLSHGAFDLSPAVDSIERDGQSGNFSIWLEASSFPSDPRDAEVKLEFSHMPTLSGSVEQKQTAVLRIAPWIMTSDLDKTKNLYIIDFSAKKIIKNGATVVSNSTLIETVTGHRDGVTVTPIVGNLVGAYRYLRDAMRFGAQTGAGDDRHFPVVMRGNNEQTNYAVPKGPDMDLTANGIGYIEMGDMCRADLQTGGNMMVSPPLKDYPWGRIICGSEGHGGLGAWKDFLFAQRVQKPVLIDTRWLEVGHSDEIVAFVPKVGTGTFKMLMASPRKAYEILAGIDLAAVTVTRRETDDTLAEQRWGQRYTALREGEAVDFSDGQLQRPLSEGNGRMFFNRHGNAGENKEQWVDQFLLDDPMLRAKASTQTSLHKQEVAQAGTDRLRELIVAAVTEFDGNWKQAQWVAIRDRAVAEWDKGQKIKVIGRLEETVSRLTLEHEGAPSAEVAAKLGLTYLIADVRTENKKWERDPAKARQWLTTANHDLRTKLAADPYEDPEPFIAKLKAIWAKLPEIVEELPNPTQAKPGDPSEDVIGRALKLDYGIQGMNSVLLNNLKLQAKLDKIRATLLDELDIKPEDVIEVPILYTRNAGRSTVADMVNLVQLNTPDDPEKSNSSKCVCIVPVPHGPIVGDEDLFQKYFAAELTGLGITNHFVDEWYEYHLNDGEIHCGSNQLPDTMKQAWWETQPPE